MYGGIQVLTIGAQKNLVRLNTNNSLKFKQIYQKSLTNKIVGTHGKFIYLIARH